MSRTLCQNEMKCSEEIMWTWIYPSKGLVWSIASFESFFFFFWQEKQNLSRDFSAWIMLYACHSANFKRDFRFWVVDNLLTILSFTFSLEKFIFPLLTKHQSFPALRLLSCSLHIHREVWICMLASLWRISWMELAVNTDFRTKKGDF